MLLQLTLYNENANYQGERMVVNMDTIVYLNSTTTGGVIIQITHKLWERFTESIEDIEMMMNYGAEKGLVFVSEKRW